MRQLNKLKVAITAGIILLIIIAIVALVLKLNNNTYFSKEASIDTVINNANENIPIKNENNSGNTNKEFIIIDDNKNSNNNNETNNINNENIDKNGKNKENEEFTNINETVYAMSSINVRDRDSKYANKIGMLNYGDSVNRTGIGKNGWSRVQYNKKIAYVSSEYLSKNKPKPIEHHDIEFNINSNRKIDPNKPMVALTFDDGPNPIATPRILDTLEKHKAVATFFDLGTCMRSYPNITKREKAIGCEIGSHTYSHKNLNNLTEKEIQDDINAAASIYENTLNEKLRLVRTPYGNANNTVKATLDYALINWDVDTLDWKTKNANSILKEIRSYKSLDGRIILMHSIYNSTADAVETLVPELINKGYQLVTVSELAKYKGYKLETGNIYYNFR